MKTSPWEEYLIPFFDGLNAMDGDYCVIHSYESLPYSAEGDIDIAINNIKQADIEALMLDICDSLNWSIMQRLWYDVPECFYYVLSSNIDRSVSVKIDLLFDKNALGYTHYSTRFLTEQPLTHNNIKHSNATAEFCYKITKRIWKGYFTESDPNRLNSLYEMSDKDVVASQLTRQYGRKYASQILQLFNSESGFTGTLPNWRKLASVQKHRYKYGSIFSFISRLKWQIHRISHRILYPCGAVLLLPASYSNVLNELKHRLSNASIDSFRYVEATNGANAIDKIKYLASSTLLLTTDASLTASVTLKTGFLNKPASIPIAELADNIETQAEAIDSLICKNLEQRISARLKF